MRRTLLSTIMQIIRRFRKTGTHRILSYILLIPTISLFLFILLTSTSQTTSFTSHNIIHHNHPEILEHDSTLTNNPPQQQQQQQKFDPVQKPVITVRNVHGIPTRTTRWPLSMSSSCVVGNGTDLRVIVMTMNRGQSLLRLLESLGRGEYEGGECIDLDIWVDKGNGEDYEEVLRVVRGYGWEFGVKSVHERLEKAGLYEQWIYTWEGIEGGGVREMAVILEDDLEVSPQYWRWLKEVKGRYGGRKDVGAYTLQRGSLRAMQIKGKYSGGLKVPEEFEVYLYLLLGTWGFAPKAECLVRFRRWFEDMRGKGLKPYVKGLMPTDWYKGQENKDGFAPRMWSMWWIKFADVNKVFTLYANMKEKTTLAANWREKGLHYSKGVPKRDYEIYNDTQFRIDWPKHLLRLDWAGRTIKGSDDEWW